MKKRAFREFDSRTLQPPFHRAITSFFDTFSRTTRNAFASGANHARRLREPVSTLGKQTTRRWLA